MIRRAGKKVVLVIQMFWAVWLVFHGPSSIPAKETDGCVNCHRSTSVKTYGGHLFSDWANSVHAQSGVGCEACHGGNPSQKAKEAAHGGVYRSGDPQSTVYFKNVPQTCGEKCHVKEYYNFTKSNHYRKLEAEGKGPNCVTCHGSMAISIISEKEMEDLCANCHNPRMGISPTRPSEARDILLLMEQTRTVIDWAQEFTHQARMPSRKKGAKAAERWLRKARGEYALAQAGWHTFEMEKLRDSLKEAYRSARSARQALKDGNGVKRESP